MRHFGSWVVRRQAEHVYLMRLVVSGIFKGCRLRINVINDYTYTLETIVQAGREKMAITSVPIRTNPELRKSRLFHSMWAYIKKSMLTIIRAYMMYRPLFFFL